MEKIISKLFKSKIENNHNLDSSTQANNLLVISLMCHITKTYHIHKHVYNIYIYICIYICIYIYIYIYCIICSFFSVHWILHKKTYFSLQVYKTNILVRLHHPRSVESQGWKTFLGTSAYKQTRNNDTKCLNYYFS